MVSAHMEGQLHAQLAASEMVTESTLEKDGVMVEMKRQQMVLDGCGGEAEEECWDGSSRNGGAH